MTNTSMLATSVLLDFLDAPTGVTSEETLKATNPKDIAANSRLDMTLFPDTAVMYGALALTEGDFKYGGYNYRRLGVSVSVYVAAVKRHLAKFYNGEWADEATDVPHLASALAGIAILIDSIEMNNHTDDRPPSKDLNPLFNHFGNVKERLNALIPVHATRVTDSD